MADTLTNINIDASTWIDVRDIANISDGDYAAIQNTGTTDLYYSISDDKPPKDSDKYRVLSREHLVVIDPNDKLWVFSPQISGLINPSIARNIFSNYWLEIAKRNIPGSTPVGIQGVNNNVSTVFKTPLTNIVPTAAGYPYSTVGEQWELVSDNANDSALGAGAQQVVVLYLDDDYVQQSEIVTLNGTVPVATAAANMFRFEGMSTNRIGSLAENQGTITIQVAGGGAQKGAIDPGENVSFHGLFTIPAGMDGFGPFIYASTSKGKDGKLSFRNTTGDNGIFRTLIPVNIYQNSLAINPTIPFGPIVEKTDIQPVAISTNPNSEIEIFYQILLVER